MGEKSTRAKASIYLRVALAACLLLLCFFGTASAADKERINGVAQFLLDRANDNALYIFEMKMKDNEALKLYLPTVYKYLEDYDLYALMQADPKIWEKAVMKDFDNLINRYVKVAERGINLLFIEHLDKTVGDIQYSVDGTECRIEFRYDASSDCLPQHINLTQEYGTILNDLLNALESESTIDQKKKQ